MGYGYGVWLVYNQKIFTQPTPHIGHITIACFMNKEDATELYNEIIEMDKLIQNVDYKQYLDIIFLVQQIVVRPLLNPVFTMAA
jgi:hypothetical protein